MKHPYHSILLIILLGYRGTQSENHGSQTIKDFIDKMKTAAKEELITEPIEIEAKNITIPPNAYISGYINMYDGRLTGLRDFLLDVNYIVLDTVPDSFNLTVENLGLHANYQAELHPFNMETWKISATGNFSFLAKNVQLLADIDLDKYNVRNSVFSIGNFDIALTDFGNETDADISRRLTEVTKEMVTTHPALISAYVEEQMNEFLNGLIDYMKMFADSDEMK